MCARLPGDQGFGYCPGEEHAHLFGTPVGEMSVIGKIRRVAAQHHAGVHNPHVLLLRHRPDSSIGKRHPVNQ